MTLQFLLDFDGYVDLVHRDDELDLRGEIRGKLLRVMVVPYHPR